MTSKDNKSPVSKTVASTELKMFNCFRKKAQLQMFDRVANAPLNPIY